MGSRLGYIQKKANALSSLALTHLVFALELERVLTT